MDTHPADEAKDREVSGLPDSGPFTAYEAAALLGVHERTIRRAIAKGELPATKRAGSYRISPMDLLAYRARDTAGRSPTRDALAAMPRLPADVQPGGERRTALPHPLTSLIGREREVAEACDVLGQGDARLLTLTGPGGVGKTRLAIAIATRLEPDFAHGVSFVRLAAIRAPELVGPAIARALGVRDAGTRSAAEILPAALHDEHLLLVLDNLEQVTGAAPWLAMLLESCPRLTVVATSRGPLRISGERRFPVAPLAVPEEGAWLTHSGLDAYAAVSLFLERAKAARPEFRVTDGSAPAVAAICRQLDGVPLALELAAARLGAMDIDTLASRLVQRLPLLTGGPRDVAARLRTMRDAIAWSHDLLSPDEQRLWRRLSVFLSGFRLDAAQAVGAALGHGPDEVVDMVTDLVDQSLLRSTSDPGRYGMLETIREFGLEQLATMGEEVAAHDAHAAWIGDMVATAARGLRGASQAVWLDRLEAEQANIRAALEWLAETGEIEHALETAASLWFFWMVRGHFVEQRGQLERLLLHPDAAARTLARARALNAAAILAGAHGDGDRALAMNAEAVAIFRDRGDRAGIAWALTAVNRSLYAKARYGEAVANAEAGLALYREMGDQWQVVRAERVLGISLRYSGDWERSVSILRASAAGGHALGDPWLEARASVDLCYTLILSSRGHMPPLETEALVVESVRLLRAIGDTYDLTEALAFLGELQWRREDLTQAVENLESALALARATGDQQAEVLSLLPLGTYAQRQGDQSRAARLLSDGLSTARDAGLISKVPHLLSALAAVASEAHQPERAARLLAAAERIMANHGEIGPDFDDLAFRRVNRWVRQELGTNAWQNARARGQGLSLVELLTEARDLQATLPAAVHSRHGLSRRELDVLRKMADGYSNAQIAEELFISTRTVASHVTGVLNKLDVPSRTAAVAFAIRAGLA